MPARLGPPGDCDATSLRQWYLETFRKLLPTADSIEIATRLWDDWETASLRRPDVSQIARDVSHREEAFFAALLERCKIEGPAPAGEVVHCALELYDYNFHKASARGGCVIVCDEAFQRLLFVLCVSLIHLAVEDVPSEARDVMAEWGRESTRDWVIRGSRNALSDEIRDILRHSYEATEMGTYLFNSMLAFALAHEVGHHALGHGRESTSMMVRRSHEKIEVPIDRQSHAEEHAADAYAWSVHARLHEIKDGRNPLCLIWWFPFAPLLLFDLCDALSRMVGSIGDSDTHPSPIARRERLSAMDANDAAGDELYAGLRRAISSVIPRP